MATTRAVRAEADTKIRVLMNSPANNAAASLGATDVGGPGGLLARLKQEAALKRAVLEQDASQLEQRTRGVDRTLRRAYAYLNDLCLQLNVLKPVWPKTFHVAETLSFGELAWGEGHANFRRQAGPTEDRPYEKVRRFCASTARQRPSSNAKIRAWTSCVSA